MIDFLLQGLMQIPNVKVVGSERKAFFDYSRRCSIVPFLIYAPRTGDGKHYLLHQNFIAAVLNDLYGIQSRGGCSCAGPYGNDLLHNILMSQGTEESVWGDYKFDLSALDGSEDMGHALMRGIVQHNEAINKPGWCRISIKYVTRAADIDFILAAVAQIAQDGWKLMPQVRFVKSRSNLIMFNVDV